MIWPWRSCGACLANVRAKGGEGRHQNKNTPANSHVILLRLFGEKEVGEDAIFVKVQPCRGFIALP